MLSIERPAEMFLSRIICNNQANAHCPHLFTLTFSFYLFTVLHYTYKTLNSTPYWWIKVPHTNKIKSKMKTQFTCYIKPRVLDQRFLIFASYACSRLIWTINAIVHIAHEFCPLLVFDSFERRTLFAGLQVTTCTGDRYARHNNLCIHLVGVWR